MAKAIATDLGKYGWQVVYWIDRNIGGNEFRSAMPDKETALMAAAADDLLESLTELLRVDDEWHGAVNSEMALARENARKAIAKATGEGR